MLNSFSKGRTIAAILLLALALASAGGVLGRAIDGPAGPASAGTVISNQAAAIYTDPGGESLSTVSQIADITVVAVSTLVVTPDEIAPSARVGPREEITRLFRVCNTGNTSDFYTITRAEVNQPATLVSVYFDNDATGTVTNGDSLVTIGSSQSQVVEAGACLGVLVVIDTHDAPVESILTIHLTAQSNTNTVNGRAADDGTIINSVGSGPRLTDPDNPNLPPLKLVNGSARAVVSAGTPFTYTISFRNSGDVSAQNVVVADDLPSGVEYVANSLRLDNRSLSDLQDADEGFGRTQHIEVRLPQILPDQTVHITFTAQLASNVPAGVGLSNTATLAGENVGLTKSSAAVVVVDPFGTVFAGRGGPSAPIAGASVAIFADQSLANLLSIPADVGFTPNIPNVNPFVTEGLGHFSFALNPSQFGTEGSPARYFLRVQAPGYISRLIEIDLVTAGDGLFVLTERALDGQPLAVAGGFELVRHDVRIDDLASLALNIPMFEVHGLEVTKYADPQRAEIGDVVTYRVEIHNPTVLPITEVSVRDRMPDSFHYVPGTARLSVGSEPERQIEPEAGVAELVFKIGEIGPGATARLLYRVRIGANAHEGDHDNLAVASGTLPSGERSETAPARATVHIGGGVFSVRQLIIGRVFEDVNRNGFFDDGDRPMPGVRLYLNSGQSVITDSQGLYNFPSLGDGAQVIALDPVNLPKGYALADGNTLAGRSWTRLLRTPIGGGAMLRQNFALVNDRPAEAENSAAPPGNSQQPENQTAQTMPTVAEESPQQPPIATAVASANRDDELDKTPALEESSVVRTYEVASTETTDPVTAGEVKIVSPKANIVVMSPALEVEARVALGWTVKLEVNGREISDKSIGTRRLDQKNQVSSFTFVAIDLLPGPNIVHATAIGPQGAVGHTEEITVLGRGPARRLEITTDKSEIQSDGRDFTILRVRAYDQWGNPAADGDVAVEASEGQLLRLDEEKRKRTPTAASSSPDFEQPPALAQQVFEARSQLIVSLDGGEAAVKLLSPGAPGEAKLRALTGKSEARAVVHITPELRPQMLVGLAEFSVGKVPEVSLRGETGDVRSRLSFFFSGRLWRQNLLTLAYDTQRPINRTAGRDRLFQLDPLDRVYPLYGDSSTRFEAAQSNSKLYVRFDHNRSYAMFGDFEADMSDLVLSGYTRKLTGVKLHLENSAGDFVTVTGARPDTSFARDVFPAGGLSIVSLSHGEILPGSETVALEVRDRRNPEIILSRESLTRSIDYNLNPTTGDLFFLRNISTFDYALNLVQIVVTYEHRASGLASNVYTARGRKNLPGLGLRLGLSAVMQRQEDVGTFVIGGIDGEKSLPGKGSLRFAWATSQGELSGGGNFFGFNSGEIAHDGNAYSVELAQPLNFHEAVIQARFAGASAGFLNPFGSTTTPGSRRAEVSFEMKPRRSSALRLGFLNEDNHTTSVDNKRLTFSAAWDETIKERVRLHLGYDHRSLSDEINDRTTDSNLVTVGAQVQVTDKLDFSVKREQNLGVPDPTYPNQTTFTSNYKLNQWARIFLTQRLASAAIVPIGDVSRTGFASTGARRETALGIESRLGKYTSMVGRYQLENGSSGTDSFAVIGLQNRLPVSKDFSLQLGFERGFHLAGLGQAFNSATVGLGWTPNNSFRASARYEFRDRGGNGQIFAVGAAGRISEGITALSRFQWSHSGFAGRNGSSLDGTAALAIRPLTSDRAGLLFSYNHRSITQQGLQGLTPTRDRLDTISTDGYYQATKALELYGRFALRFNANGQPTLPFVSTLSYLTQARAQYRLTTRFDWAGETRVIFQPSTRTQHSVFGTELGFWAIPDLRLGVGYNFTMSGESSTSRTIPDRRGFYFTISSKLSNLFDLFGTSKQGLAESAAGGKKEKGGKP